MINLHQQNKLNTIIDWILDSNTFASTSLQLTNKEDFYWFNGQYYEPNAESQIVKQTKQHFPNVHITDKEISKIITSIQELSTVTDNFDSDPNLACYLNGVYNNKENKLYPFSPRYFITFQINQNYIDNTSTLTQNLNHLALLNYID